MSPDRLIHATFRLWEPPAFPDPDSDPMDPQSFETFSVEARESKAKEAKTRLEDAVWEAESGGAVDAVVVGEGVYKRLLAHCWTLDTRTRPRDLVPVDLFLSESLRPHKIEALYRNERKFTEMIEEDEP